MGKRSGFTSITELTEDPSIDGGDPVEIVLGNGGRGVLPRCQAVPELGQRDFLEIQRRGRCNGGARLRPAAAQR
jgi:hypothetical protein